MQQFREVSRTRTIYSTETHTSDFILHTAFSNGKPVQFFPGKVLSGDVGVPREQVLQHIYRYKLSVLSVCIFSLSYCPESVLSLSLSVSVPSPCSYLSLTMRQ